MYSKFRIMFVHYGWTLFGVFVENINFCTKCNSGNTGPFNFFCWKTASSLETQGHSLTLSSKVNLQLLRDGLRREKLKPFSPALKRGKIWKYIERKMMLRSKWLTLEHACLQLCMREILAVKNFAHFHQSLGKVKLLLAKQAESYFQWSLLSSATQETRLKGQLFSEWISGMHQGSEIRGGR